MKYKPINHKKQRMIAVLSKYLFHLFLFLLLRKLLSFSIEKLKNSTLLAVNAWKLRNSSSPAGIVSGQEKPLNIIGITFLFAFIALLASKCTQSSSSSHRSSALGVRMTRKSLQLSMALYICSSNLPGHNSMSMKTEYPADFSWLATSIATSYEQRL